MLKLAYNGSIKSVLKECTYKYISDSFGGAITVARLKLVTAVYNGVYKFMNFLMKNDDKGEQYCVMNYVAPVEKALETVIQEIGEDLLKEPSQENVVKYEYAYNLLRFVNEYLYESLYNYSTLAHNDEDAKYATLYKHSWQISKCHDNLIHGKSKYVSIQCPVDVFLYNTAGDLVLAITDDEIGTYTDEKITAMVCGHEKSIVYPADADYRIKIVASDEGTMDYAVAEVNGMLQTRTVEFYDIPLTENQVFQGNLPKEFGIENVVYTLETDRNTVMHDYDSDDQKSCEASGHTYGAWIEEIPPTSENFGLKKRRCSVCGKIEDESIRPLANSRFAVSFDANEGYVSTLSNLTDNGRITTLPTPIRPGYTFLGWFTSPTGGTQVTTDTVFTQDTTIYAHWQKNSSGGSSGGYPSVSFYNVGIEKAEHGTVTSKPSSIYSGGTVTLTDTPDEGYRLDSITVTDSQGKEIEVTENGGKCTFTMPGHNVTVKAVFVPVQTATPTPIPTPTPVPTQVPTPTPAPTAEPWKNPFPDVKEGAWYYKAVEYVCVNGLMAGYTNGNFGPSDSLTRAQFAQVIYNKEGKPEAGNSVFADVQADLWYANAVTWAEEQNIVTGVGNNQFAPNRDITREELATMLWRYVGCPEPKNNLLDYVDSDKVSNYALKAMMWASENNIVNGKPGKILDPRGTAKRSEVAQMLMNYLSK